MLSPEQRRDAEAEIDRSLNRARESLRAIASKSLSTSQQSAVAQIQSFIQQAELARKTDLSSARSLAQKADILARDLAGNLR